MERIGVRDLRQYASTYLDRVKAGETVEVTEHGKLIALLVPPGRTHRDQLVAAGHLIPATLDSCFPEPLEQTGGASASTRLMQARADER